MEQPPTRKNGTPDLSGNSPVEGPPQGRASRRNRQLAGLPFEGCRPEPHAPEAFWARCVGPAVEPSEETSPAVFLPSDGGDSRRHVCHEPPFPCSVSWASPRSWQWCRASTSWSGHRADRAPEAPVTVRRAPLALAIPLPSQKLLESIPSPPVQIKETPPPRRSDAVVAGVCSSGDPAERGCVGRAESQHHSPDLAPRTRHDRAASSGVTPIYTLAGHTSAPLLHNAANAGSRT